MNNRMMNLNKNLNNHLFHDNSIHDFNPLYNILVYGLDVMVELLSRRLFVHIDVMRRLKSWAKTSVNLLLFLQGTILPIATYRRDPANTYNTRSSNENASTVVIFKGKSLILKLISDFVGGSNELIQTPNLFYTLQEFVNYLDHFIENKEEEETVDEEEEDDDMHDSSLVCGNCNDRTEQDTPVFVCPRCGTALCEFCEDMLVRNAPIDNLEVCPFCWSDADDAFEEENETSDESEDDEDDDETSDVEML